MAIAFVLVALFGFENKEFIDTASKQLKEGYSWNKIECREAIPGLPAITINYPDGTKYVCGKLKK
jgi:hypothetical protein